MMSYLVYQTLSEKIRYVLKTKLRTKKINEIPYIMTIKAIYLPLRSFNLLSSDLACLRLKVFPIIQNLI